MEMRRTGPIVPIVIVLGFLAAGSALIGGAASGSAADSGHTTAAATPASSAGRFVWQDLMTPDAAACRKFYGDLLGWQFHETTRNGKPYLIARLGGKPVAGIVEVKDPRVKDAGWLSYLSVDDIDHAVSRVTAAGGAVLVAPLRIEGIGRIAAVTDPEGAPLGLAGLEIEAPAEPADPPLARFFWREYFAHDAAKSLAFYRELDGYQDTLSTRKSLLPYHLLERNGPQAGLIQLPEELMAVKSNWLPYLRVDDPAAMSARVTTLGGRVILPASAELRNGTVAIVADPTGGAVALQRWPI
jgi:predicted enzyme related to lactoylglutathione lyase